MQVIGVKHSSLKTNQKSVNLTQNKSKPSFGFVFTPAKVELMKYLPPERMKAYSSQLSALGDSLTKNTPDASALRNNILTKALMEARIIKKKNLRELVNYIKILTEVADEIKEIIELIAPNTLKVA